MVPMSGGAPGPMDLGPCSARCAAGTVGDVERGFDVVEMGPAGLQAIVDDLTSEGFDVHGPSERDGALTVGPMTDAGRLPVGRRDECGPGRAGLVDRDDRARFGWSVPAQSWKRLLHPPAVVTMTMTQAGPAAPVRVTPRDHTERPLALLGVRPCELAAIGRLDRVLVDHPSTPDPEYVHRRNGAFTVVVNCGSPSATCRCTTVGTGPHLADGQPGRNTAAAAEPHDLLIDELPNEGDEGEPLYVVSAGSGRGRALVLRLVDAGVARAAGRWDEAIAAQRERAAAEIDRRGDGDPSAADVAGSLAARFDDAWWDEIAERCVACGNCTAVCPTCFCTAVDDVGDLAGTSVERHRRWESCFSLEFSRVGDRPVRESVGSRYRQWMTHKLDTWHDQFGESGCVGCGRCTTWCPVGIEFLAGAEELVGTSPGGGGEHR